MRFLFIGDVHIKNDNSEEIDILLNEIERIFSQQKYDYIIVGGDVMHYHERLFTQCLNKSLFFLNKLSQKAYTYVLVGNHDYINNSEFLSENHWMNTLKTWNNLKIVDNVIEEKDFILCPYVYPGRFIEALETKTKEWNTKKIIFAHQEFKGCKMGAIISIEGDEWNESYPHVISGHIHDNQKVGNNIYYPGTPLQHSFGDSDKRILCDILIDDDEKQPKIKDIDLNVPKKRIIKTNLSNISNISNLCKNQTDKIKIKLDVSNEEFKLFKETKDYKELINKGIKIQINKKKIESTSSHYESTQDNENNFTFILEKMIENDEPLVKTLYEEIVLNKILIPL
jgi:DNA repair exonuclease SbcCD nuclease subunit